MSVFCCYTFRADTLTGPSYRADPLELFTVGSGSFDDLHSFNISDVWNSLQKFLIANDKAALIRSKHAKSDINARYELVGINCGSADA